MDDDGDDDDSYLRNLAARLGLPADATTNADLERALASRLGFDARTDEWSLRWMLNLIRRGETPERVVQEPKPARSNPALPGRRRARPPRR